MSLEQSISELNATMTKLVEQNEKILGMAAERLASGAAGSAASTETKNTRTKKTDAKKDDTAGDADTKAIAKSDLTTATSAWLNEFGKPGEHPESTARHGALKTVLQKVGGDGFNLKVLEETDSEKITKLYNWLENTAKKADKGFGTGRLAADPAPAEDGDGDDDLGV